MAGKLRNEPPPATALSDPARKEATITQGRRQSIVLQLAGSQVRIAVKCI